MPIPKKSSFTKGNARTRIPTMHKAGTVCQILHTHVFDEAVTTADILEVLPLPSSARITNFMVSGEDIGAGGLAIGVMDGAFAAETDRSIATPLFAAQAANAQAAVPLATLGNIAKVADGGNLGIGVVPATDIAAGSTKKLHFLIEYVA
ncbi:hypothetical protein [Celeribacter sp.]|uniref:hypothetical protein n=1 Tax=Celeribacter sp. TaxID=1890673 RepID=UPI003A950BAE